MSIPRRSICNTRKITSPVAGRVGLRQVDVGNLVESGQTNGVVVVTADRSRSRFYSPSRKTISTPSWRRSTTARSLRVDAYDRSQTTKLATGTLVHRRQPDRSHDRHGEAAGQFRQRGWRAVPAAIRQRANFWSRRCTIRSIVPAAAIERGSSGAFVYVVNSDSTVSMRAVTLGCRARRQAGDHARTQGRRNRRDRRRGPLERRRGCDRAQAEWQAQVSTAASSAGTPSASDATRQAASAAMAAAMKQYCSEDIAKYCPNMKPGTPEMRQCFFENMSQLQRHLPECA